MRVDEASNVVGGETDGTQTARPGTLSLRSEDLDLELDAQHGAEIVRLADRRRGLDLLATPPYEPAVPADGELEELAWTRAYRGGWQILTPNAGDACHVNGVRHGFHGRASHAPWQVDAVSAEAVTLSWRGHGLTVTRTYHLEGRTLAATTTWRAHRRPAPMVHVEHLAVGRALLDPEVIVRLPGGWAAEHPAEPQSGLEPHGSRRWPDVALLDGTVEQAGRWRLTETRYRFAVVRDIDRGHAEIENPARKLRIRLEWDARQLPHVWLWHEVRGSGGLWSNRTELLGLEPASVPHAFGLRRATDAGQATWVKPGRPVEHRVVLRMESDGDR